MKVSNEGEIKRNNYEFLARQSGRKLQMMASRAIALLFLLSGFVLAQSSTDQSNVKFTSGAVSDSAIVSLGVPLGNYPGRGLDLPVSLSYSSTVWRIEHVNEVQNTVAYPGYSIKQSTAQAIYGEHSTSGWKSTLELPQIEFPKLDEIYDYKGKPSSYGYNYRIAKVFIHMPDGSTHELRKGDGFYNSNSIDMVGTFYAVDSSRMRYDSTGADTGTLYMSDGTKYILGHPTSSIIDRNGNTQTYSETTRQWTDTLGRVINNPIPANPQAQDYAYSLPGLNGGTINYTFKWRNLADALTPNANNTTPALRVMASHYLPYPNSLPTSSNQGGNFPQAQSSSYQSLFQSAEPARENTGEEPPFPVPTLVVGKGQTGGIVFNPVVLTEVILPNGTSYKFSYNVYGEVDKVIYPTSAYDKYQYDANVTEFDSYSYPYTEANRRVQSRKQSVDGTGNDILEWKYLESAYTYNLGNPLEDSNGYRKTSIIAPNNTRTEIYKHNPMTPGDISGKVYWAFGLSDSRAGMVIQKNFYSTSADGLGGQLLKREITQYEQTTNTYTYTAQGINPTYTKTINAYRNPRPVKQVSIVFEGNGSALAQTKTFSYDTTNQMTTGIDQTVAATYTFAVVANATAITATIGQIPTGDLANSVETAYLNSTNYQNRNILGLTISATIKNVSGNPVRKLEISYDEYALSSPGSPSSWQDPQTSIRGNTTTARVYSDIANNQFIETHSQFDQFGHLVSATDGKGNVTTTDYSSIYSYAYPTSVTTPAPDTSGMSGSQTGFTASTVYDATTGSPTSTTDANGQTTQISYTDAVTGTADPFLRVRKVTAPNGHQTISEYGPGTSLSTCYVKVKMQIDETKWKESYTWYDGIGRTIKKQSVDSGGDVFVDTQYDNMGRTKKVTNPYRSNETVYWTENFYDDLSRVIKIKTPDTAEVNTSYSLATAGNQIGTAVTVTDQAGKQRRSVTNALGQLTRVDEPDDNNNLGTIDAPVQSTLYSYDILNNLTQIQQSGTNSVQCGGTNTNCSQTRNFVYDSLSRLKNATNPELGLINYTYDNNGNLQSKTDARQITTTYAYDNLNRVKVRTYSDGVTPSVNYFYDNLANAKGKLIKVSSTVSNTEYSEFDILGRVTKSKQTTDGTPYPEMTYTYNLSGALVEEKYPSGRIVKNVLDENGDLELVQSKKNQTSGFWNYAKSFSYTAAGSASSMQLGNGKWESTQFNSRLQPTQIALGTVQGGADKLKLNYDYGATDNNGNIKAQTIIVPMTGNAAGFTAIQNYSYDSLNRLKSATETIGGSQSWKQTFVFDRYGNRNFDTNNTTTLGSCSANQCNPSVDVANNRFTTGQGYIYDLSGNIVTDAQGKTFAYDAENKQKSVSNTGGSLGTYFYDGDGKRVKKVVGAETTIFVYDAVGKLVAEYSNLTNSSPQVNYLTSDTLGSPRINTDASGNVFARHDYLPFGEEIDLTKTAIRNVNLNYGDDGVKKKFTSYERDNESGLDFAQARMFSYSHGRFTSPDEFFNDTDLSDPASWNLYAYVRNNPLKYVDPNGEQILVRFDEKDEDGNVTPQTVQYLNGKLYSGTFNSKGQFVRGDEYAGNNQYALDARNYLNELRTDKESDLGSRISTLERSSKVHTIMKNPTSSDANYTTPQSESDAENKRSTGSKVYWSGKDSMISSGSGGKILGRAYSNLAHELLGHSYALDQGKEASGIFHYFDSTLKSMVFNENGKPYNTGFPNHEFNAVEAENSARAFGGDSRREGYGSYTFPKVKPVLKRASP